MVSILFFILAAICNAVMDRVAERPLFNESIFKGWPKWWDHKDKTWRRKYLWDVKGKLNIRLGRRKLIGPINYPVQLLDPWHFFKMLMVLFIACSIVTALMSFYDRTWFSALVALTLYGLIWNFTFTIFYDWVLKRKGK